MRVWTLYVSRWARAIGIPQQAGYASFKNNSGLTFVVLGYVRAVSLPVPSTQRHVCSSRAILSMASSSGAAATGQSPDLANLRENYVSSGIDEKALPSEPHVLMENWVETACNSKDVSDPYPSWLTM